MTQDQVVDHTTPILNSCSWTSVGNWYRPTCIDDDRYGRIPAEIQRYRSTSIGIKIQQRRWFTIDINRPRSIHIYTTIKRALRSRTGLRNYITEICYGRYITTEILQQIYYSKHITADILRQIYYSRYVKADILRQMHYSIYIYIYIAYHRRWQYLN